MRPSDIWPKRARIIEIGAASGAIGQRLVAAGFRGYLAVVQSNQRREAMAERWPGIARKIAIALPQNDIRQNNADVLLLDGWAALAAGRLRSVRHAQYIALRLQPTPLCWFGVLLAIAQCLLYRLAWPRIINCSRSGAGPWLLAFRIRKPRPHTAVRRFIPHELDIAGFATQLQAAGVRHAVLRWFENLPQLPPGEDLDLLVDDAKLDKVRQMLESGPGIQPVDLYSVTGLPGADFRSMPYFPPHLAEQLLERAVVHRGSYRVPSAREHFLSLAYHALYHKGLQSGIPATEQSTANSATAGHDYTSILRRYAAALNIQVAITLESLDTYLDAQGWRPPHDMLIRLARRNRWVRSLLHHGQKDSSADDRVAVFLVREVALQRGGVERAAALVERHGFQILKTHRFDDRNVPVLARTLRGGNWGRGPWPISGGPPVAAIVAYDPAPIAPSRKQKKRFPFVANARLLCKEQLRDAFNEGLPNDQHCNVIHSSDNGREALDYLRIILPDAISEIFERPQSPPIARAA